MTSDDRRTTPEKRRSRRPPGIDRLDRRTREGKFLKAAKADLLARLGRDPTPAEALLVERAATLAYRLAVLDEQLGRLTDQQARDHRMATGAYWRLVSRLLAPPKQRPGRPRKRSAAAAATTLPAATENALWGYLKGTKL